MNKCSLKVLAGSTIRLPSGEIPFKHLAECEGGSISLDDAGEFASQCTRDATAGVELSAADYNNWGCCLAWKEPVPDIEGACTRFAKGLLVPSQDSDGYDTLKRNLKTIDPGLPIEYLVAQLPEIDEGDKARLTEILGGDKRDNLW